MEKFAKWQLAVAAVFLAASAAVSLIGKKGPALTAYSDITGLALWALCVGVMLWAATCNQGRTRWFWVLLAFGAAMVGINYWGWFYYEIVAGKPTPDPFWGDIPLFLQPVPMMAAAAMRPGSKQREQKFHLTTLNFLVLLLWWVCLYMFLVYPNEFILPNKAAFDVYYYGLFILEFSIFLTVLGGMALVAKGAWRRIYWELFGASALYLVFYSWLNSALGAESYYSGSWYDVPDYVVICWYILIAVRARNVPSEPLGESEQRERNVDISGILAVLAVLSVPVIGLCELFLDPNGHKLRPYRVCVAMISVFLLGVCVFLRQMLMAREMKRLLAESKQNLSSLQQAQRQLVQKERLAGVGQLVAGVAHELNNPLTAVIGYSDLLVDQATDSTKPKLEKLGVEARRIKKIIDNLLSFARPQAEERRAHDIAVVVRESLMLCEYQIRKAGITVEIDFAPDLPKVEINGGQFKQVFVNLFTNCANALEEAREKKIRVEGRLENGKVMVRFMDSGPGFKDVSRAFDPFYTTRPVGQGTGLGLSVCYGMLKEHDGNIYAENLEPNGAAVTVEVPA
jgi:signal transduction histidine kinase